MELKCALFDESPQRAARNAVLFDNASRIYAALDKLEKTEHQIRKFLVFKNDKTVYVIFGAAFVDNQDHESYYFHRDLRQAALNFLDKDGSKRYEVAGGGVIKFTYLAFSTKWSADFGGSSSDYGVFDPVIVDNPRPVVDWLGMPVTFTWRKLVYPTKK